MFGLTRYPTLEEKACALAYAITHSHVFLDGNKRTGTEVLYQMLELNGRTLEVTHEDLVATIEATADGSLSFEGFVDWARNACVRGAQAIRFYPLASLREGYTGYKPMYRWPVSA